MNQIETLQAELNEIVEGLTGPVAVLLEGRDTAGKSSTIREVTHYLNPALYSVHLSRKPSKSTMKKWLGYWSRRMPACNQIVFYDRSWYSRAMVQRLNGWCSTSNTRIFWNAIKHGKNHKAFTWLNSGFRFQKMNSERESKTAKRHRSPTGNFQRMTKTRFPIMMR